MGASEHRSAERDEGRRGTDPKLTFFFWRWEGGDRTTDPFQRDSGFPGVCARTRRGRISIPHDVDA